MNDEQSLLWWLYSNCGFLYFSLLLLTFFGGLVFAGIALVGAYSNRLAKWAIPVAVLPLIVGLIGTAHAYIQLHNWSVQLADMNQTMKHEEREQFVRTAWVTTYFGATCTVPLLGVATLAVFLKKTRPDSTVVAQTVEASIVNRPIPPSVADESQRNDARHLEQCPNCHTTVVRKADGRCPACQSPMA